MKTLNQFVEQTGYRKVKSPDEQKFVDKHIVQVLPDRAGNKDDVFKASNLDKVDRKKDRKGYEPGEDEAVYEAMDAAARFNHHHQHAKALMKSISQHMKTHAAEAASYKDHKGRKGPSWGHTGSMEHIANQLSNIHDQLARTGEYKMHEEADLEEKTLTPAEMKKREEVAKAIKRENPRMPMAKKMAIATATAKKVAEDFDGAIGGLPSLTQDILKAAFDRLNEDNKSKFVAACQTEDGLEKMVAFAIENRGA